MAHISERYEQKFYVLFNSKSQVIIYRAYNIKPPDLCVTTDGTRVKRVDKVIHLGHLLTENVYQFSMSKYIDEFICQCTMFRADFKYCSSHIINVSFHWRYCTSFYGTQMLPHFDTNIQDEYTAWRIIIRRVWRLPWKNT